MTLLLLVVGKDGDLWLVSDGGWFRFSVVYVVVCITSL